MCPCLPLSADEWIALGTVVTALVAVAAAVVGYFQLREFRHSRREQVQPFVVVDIVPSRVSRQILNLVVENIGKTMATNVRISFDPDLTTSQSGYDLGSSALLTEAVPSLPPGRRIEAFFDTSTDRFKTELPTRYVVTVVFESSDGEPYAPLTYIVDFGFLYGLHYIEERTIHNVADTLRSMESRMKSWTDQGRLGVSSLDTDRQHQRDRTTKKLTGHYPSLGRAPLSDFWLAVGRLPFAEYLYSAWQGLRRIWVRLRERAGQTRA